MKAIIFDFNGTLFFDDDKHVLAWNEISLLIRHKGITMEELHNKLNGVTNAKIIEYFDPSLSKEEINDYSLKKEEIYREKCQEDKESFHLVSGANEYFDYLKKEGIPFTIASASIKENIDFFVSSFHLDDWIDPDLIVYDNGQYENKIAMFKQASRNLDTNPEDVLVFEDSLSGIQNAYKAGIKEIIVIRNKEYVDLPGVVRVIDSFDEML